MMFGDRRPQSVNNANNRKSGSFLSTFRNSTSLASSAAEKLAEKEREREKEKEMERERKTLSSVSFSADWKDELDDAEDDDDDGEELLRSCMHSLGDLDSDDQQLRLVLRFHQTDLASQNIVADVKVERTVHSVIQFYRAFCTLHSLPMVLSLEDDLATCTALSLSLSLSLYDLQQQDDARDRLLQKIQSLFTSVSTLLGPVFWEDTAVRAFLSEDRQETDVEFNRLQCQVEHWKDLIVSAQRRLSTLRTKFRKQDPQQEKEKETEKETLAIAIAPGNEDTPNTKIDSNKSNNRNSSNSSNNNNNNNDERNISVATANETLSFHDLLIEDGLPRDSMSSSGSERLTFASTSTVGYGQQRPSGPQDPRGHASFYNARPLPSVPSVPVTPVANNRSSTPMRPIAAASHSSLDLRNDAKPALIVAVSPVPAVASALPVSSHLPVDLLTILRSDALYEGVTSEIVRLVSHFPHSLHASKLSFFQKHCLSSPTARLFDVGLQAIDFALCDDEMRVCLLGDAASLGTECAFPSTLLEQAVSAALTPFASTKKNRETMVRDEVVGDFAIGFNPSLQNKEKGTLQGSLSGTPFVFLFQEHVDACLLLLFDEMNEIVNAYQRQRQRKRGDGCAHTHDLFKQSVRLIRAWWLHESITIVGVSVKQSLSVSSFLLMVAAVFNQFYEAIDTPLQAFALFFAEYSAWQTSTEAITVCGRVSKEDKEKARQLAKRETDAPLLFSEELFIKYRQLLHWPARPTLSAAPLSDALCVLSPLNGENLITETLSANQIARVSKALQGGASNLALFLKQLSSEQGGIRDAELIKNYFPNVLTAFAERIEEMSGHIKRSAPFNAEESRAALTLCARYGCVVQSAVCDRDGVCLAVTGLLQSHGPLRASELYVSLRDKVLSGAAKSAILSALSSLSCATLVAAIKEEGASFLLLDDGTHPQDPLVVLRESLSTQHVSLVERGLLTAQGVLDLVRGQTSCDSSVSSSPQSAYARTTSFDELSSVGSASVHSSQSSRACRSLQASPAEQYRFLSTPPNVLPVALSASGSNTPSLESHSPRDAYHYHQHQRAHPFHNNANANNNNNSNNNNGMRYNNYSSHNNSNNNNNNNNNNNTINNNSSFAAPSYAAYSSPSSQSDHLFVRGRGQAHTHSQHVGRSLAQPFAPIPGRGHSRSRYAVPPPSAQHHPTQQMQQMQQQPPQYAYGAANYAPYSPWGTEGM